MPLSIPHYLTPDSINDSCHHVRGSRLVSLRTARSVGTFRRDTGVSGSTGNILVDAVTPVDSTTTASCSTSSTLDILERCIELPKIMACISRVFTWPVCVRVEPYPATLSHSSMAPVCFGAHCIDIIVCSFTLDSEIQYKSRNQKHHP